MKSIIISLALTLSTISFGLCQKNNTSNKSKLDGIEIELKKVLDTWNTSGFAVAVVEKNKIIYAKGFGYRDFENKIPVDANTLFAIGSCTKAFTAGLLGCLENEGKLSFSESPRKYLPDLRFYKPEMNEFIQIRDLVIHSTGIPRHDLSWHLFRSFSKDSLAKRIAFHEPIAALREKFHYNNFMYVVQGLIAEKITQKSWEDNVSERFFKPLSMNNSNLSIDNMVKNKNASLGYETNIYNKTSKVDYYHLQGMGPAGSINSSVNDMANWLITWINGGKFMGKEILPTNYVKNAISSQMVITDALPTKENPDVHLANYGFAWFLSSYKGHYRVEHGGNIDGFTASTCFFPSDSIGIVVLTNQGGSLVPPVVRNIIADRILGLLQTDWNQQLWKQHLEAIKAETAFQTSLNSNKKNATTTSHSLDAFQGTYHHPGYGSLVLKLEKDSLFASYKEEVIWLKHYHYDIFEPFLKKGARYDTTNLGIKFNFITNEFGDISGFKTRFEESVEPIFFEKKISEIKLDPNMISKYIGEYDMEGASVKLTIKQDSKLFILVQGYPEFELIPIEKNKFSVKSLDGYKVEFLEEINGDIKSLLIIQPEGSTKAKKK